MLNSDIQHRSIFLLKQTGVAALYALLIFLDHRFFESGTTVSSFEAASGFGLAVLLIGGKRYVWGVFLGAILINAMTNPFGAAVAISSGDALEAFCGAWLLTRDNSKFDLAIRSLRDYLRLILMGGVVGVSISANFGVTALLVFGFITPENFPHELAHWWTGDMLGVTLITPLILVFRHTKNEWLGTKRVAEAVLLLGLTFLAGQVIFLGWLHSRVSLFEEIAKGYWMFLFVFLVAARLGTRGTVIAINMVAVQALLGAYQGTGFFAHDIAQTQLANYWCYTMILSIVGLALATYFSERKLREEILRRSEIRLRTLYESTSDAVMLLDEKGFFDCNRAALAIFGCAIKEEFCSKHPADLSPPEQPCGTDSLTLANQRIATAMGKGHHQFEWMHRRADTGKTFPADVLLDSMELDGRTVLQATVRDITERKQAEDTLRKLSLAVEQSPSSIVITDLNANIEYVNQAFVRETGYSFDETIGQNPRILNSGKNWKAIYAEMWGCLNRGEVWKGELINRRKDGSEYIEAALISPIHQLDGRVTHYLAIKENITQRKENELKMERLTRIYHLLSQVNEGIVRAHDENSLFAAVCNAAIVSGLFRFTWIGLLDEQKLSVIPMVFAGGEEGYTDRLNIRLDDEHTGNGPTGRAIRSGAHVVCQDIESDPSMEPWRDEALRLGYRASGVFPLYRAGDLAGAINVYAAEVHFFTRDIVRLMLELAADVSFALDVFSEKQRREQAEDEVRRINVELEHRVLERTRQMEAANKELEAFSYSVSHDLRAPLRSIDGFSRVLSKNYYAQLDATGKDWLERICRASQHMGRLIDDMLQLSMVARGPLNRDWVDLSGIAKDVADDLSKAYPERQVRFTLQQGLSVQADPGLLRIVMNNLLGNAFKFTGKKANAEIEFGACDANGGSVFFVRDNGDGFNMNYANKLFGAFQRLHAANEFEGTGIGLATVQRVIYRHNGKVWAEAKEGHGAAFYFTLPQRERETHHEDSK